MTRSRKLSKSGELRIKPVTNERRNAKALHMAGASGREATDRYERWATSGDTGERFHGPARRLERLVRRLLLSSGE